MCHPMCQDTLSHQGSSLGSWVQLPPGSARILLMWNDWIPAWTNAGSGLLRLICHSAYITDGVKEEWEGIIGPEGAKEGQEQSARWWIRLQTALCLLGQSWWWSLLVCRCCLPCYRSPTWQSYPVNAPLIHQRSPVIIQELPTWGLSCSWHSDLCLSCLHIWTPEVYIIAH